MLRQPTPGLIVHSGRGSQYASQAHPEPLAGHGLVASMSRQGKGWDNAVMERIFPNLFPNLNMKRVWQPRYIHPAEAMADASHDLVGLYDLAALRPRPSITRRL